MKLWKTTLVIWSDSDPRGMEASHLVREGEVGDAYISRSLHVFVDPAEGDPDWDGTEFFGVEDDAEEEPEEEPMCGVCGVALVDGLFCHNPDCERTKHADD